MNSRRNNGKDMGLGSSGKGDNTPFDGSGLKLKSVKTRRELNEVEFDSILRVTEKSRRWSCGLASALFGYPAVGVNRSGEFKLREPDLN